MAIQQMSIVLMLAAAYSTLLKTAHKKSLDLQYLAKPLQQRPFAQLISCAKLQGGEMDHE
jgi:hypothetical protein